jgi:hypothetical protein
VGSAQALLQATALQTVLVLCLMAVGRATPTDGRAARRDDIQKEEAMALEYQTLSCKSTSAPPVRPMVSTPLLLVPPPTLGSKQVGATPCCSLKIDLCPRVGLLTGALQGTCKLLVMHVGNYLGTYPSIPMQVPSQLHIYFWFHLSHY